MVQRSPRLQESQVSHSSLPRITRQMSLKSAADALSAHRSPVDLGQLREHANTRAHWQRQVCVTTPSLQAVEGRSQCSALPKRSRSPGIYTYIHSYIHTFTHSYIDTYTSQPPRELLFSEVSSHRILEFSGGCLAPLRPALLLIATPTLPRGAIPIHFVPPPCIGSPSLVPLSSRSSLSLNPVD
jgi:hypothetical protein